MKTPLDLFDPSRLFTVDLPPIVHQRADQQIQQCPDLLLAEQMYGNILVVHAVDFYLQCLGFATDIVESDSADPILQLCANSAPLFVKQHGYLECRRVVSGKTTMQVPPEVWHDRIGYLAVELDDTLETATILGFVDRAQQVEIPLSALRSLDEFPTYLQACHHQPASWVKLGQWLEGYITQGWATIAEILDPQSPAFALEFRSKPHQIQRSKAISLGESGPQVALMVTLEQTEASDINIQVEVVPADKQQVLPSGLQLSLLDEAAHPLMNAQTTHNHQRLCLEFSGAVGDRFDVTIVWQEVTVTETFVI